MRASSRGFTLVEVLVATAVLAIFMIGILNLLDTSSRLSEVEKALADTQENVRFAAYHLMRTARMVGGSTMPVADDATGTALWIAAGVDNNQSGSYTTPFGTSVDVIDGSDVLLLRGFFEVSPFFVETSDVESGPARVEVRETTSSQGGNVITNAIDSVAIGEGGAVSGLEGRGLVFMGNLERGEYTIGQVASGATVTGSSPNRVLKIPIEAEGGTASWWTALRPSGGDPVPPPFEVYRVGVLESYAFYVSPQRELRRLRADAGGATDQPVAVNIGALQIALGTDADDDGIIEWDASPTAAEAAAEPPVAMRITVLGRTPFRVAGWTEPSTTFTGAGDLEESTVDHAAKWRRIEVSAALRNYLF